MTIKLSNGKKAKVPENFTGEDFAAVKINRALACDFLRKDLPPDKPVKFLKETIFFDDSGDYPCEDTYWITIINHESRSLQVPLKMLAFSQKQKEELVERNLVPLSFFKKEEHIEDGYYEKG
jgi:hypothetical protein